jgi:hypothetical protein
MSGEVDFEEKKRTSEPAQASPAGAPEVVTPAAETSDPLRPSARLVETSLPADKKEKDKLQPVPAEVKVLRPATPVRPLALTPHAEEPAPRYPGLERVLSVARRVLPVVQRVLPLLEGNVPLTVANLLAPAFEAPRRPVNLQPLENAVDKLHTEQVELRTQVVAQAATLQRLGERVAALQEQADRNARERKEMAEGLRRLRRTVARIAWIGFLLLAALLAANAFLLWRILGLGR